MTQAHDGTSAGSACPLSPWPCEDLVEVQVGAPLCSPQRPFEPNPEVVRLQSVRVADPHVEGTRLGVWLASLKVPLIRHEGCYHELGRGTSREPQVPSSLHDRRIPDAGLEVGERGGDLELRVVSRVLLREEELTIWTQHDEAVRIIDSFHNYALRVFDPDGRPLGPPYASHLVSQRVSGGGAA